MKNIVIILLSCLLVSCGRDTYQDFVIRNKTGHNVEIVGFVRRFPPELWRSDTIIILAQDSFLVERVNGEMSDNRTFYSIDPVDSVRVIFDIEKLLVLTCEGDEESCHPLVSSYFSECTITNDDYDIAIAIE